MNKDVLTRFISKYHLSGNINTAIWRNNDSTLSTRFISGDKSLLGNVSLDEFDVEDYMSDTIIGGLPQQRGEVVYMWNGIMFFNMLKIID